MKRAQARLQRLAKISKKNWYFCTISESSPAPNGGRTVRACSQTCSLATALLLPPPARRARDAHPRPYRRG
eukprot:2139705-Prymnesium_polylepis.1